jgi:hypothetical protein
VDKDRRHQRHHGEDPTNGDQQRASDLQALGTAQQIVGDHAAEPRPDHRRDRLRRLAWHRIVDRAWRPVVVGPGCLFPAAYYALRRHTTCV